MTNVLWKTLSSLLLVAAIGGMPVRGPAWAQSLEVRMRTAAGAYERKDFALALSIWKPLAGEGNAEAETLLGAMYWQGEGVARDHAEASRLYLAAAEQGYARAQNNIGFMYGFGEGIPPRDDVQAYKWISLAVDRYTVKNQERRDQAAKDLATLKARMSPTQLAEAEAAIKAWKPRP
jgi:TPR repeat protein